MALTKIPGSGINANSVTPAVLTEIQSSFNSANSTLTVPNLSANTVSAGNVKTDSLLYANGSAYVFTTTAAGSNTQIQFNNASSFAGSANLTFNTTTNTLTTTNFAGNGSGLSSLTGANVNGTVASASTATTANAVAGANVSGTVANATYAITSGTAYSVSGANVSGAVSLATFATTANAVAGANVSGQVSNALVTSTVYSNAQPNITSVGTLTSLSVTGNVTGNFFIGNGSQLTGVSATTATTTVTVTASSQPNITSVGTLTSLITSGDVTVGGNLTVNGTTTTINAATLAVTDLNITVAKDATTAASANGAGLTVGGTAAATILYTSSSDTWNFNKTIVGNLTGLASSATVSASANAVAGANVSGAVSLATFATTANAVAGANVSGQVANALVSGTVYTNAQPNITSTGTLTSLVVSGNLSAGNATLGNLVTANFFTGNGSLLTGIAKATSADSVANGTSNVNIPTVNGNIQLASGGNLTGIITSTGVNVAGYLTVAGTTSLGAAGNVKITGGAADQVLTTDGNGTLSWSTPSTTTLTVDSFTGNGVQTVYTLSATPINVNYVFLSVAGISQPRNRYSLIGNTVTISSAPAVNAVVEFTTMVGGGINSTNSLYYRLNTDYVGTNATGAQRILGVGVTLSASTVYQFEAVYALSRSAGTTFHTIGHGFGGTATLNNIAYTRSWQYSSSAFNAPASATGNYAVNSFIQTASSTSLPSETSSVSTAYWVVFIKGTVSVNASGTFIPQYTLSAAPGGAYTVAAGSYITFTPIGQAGTNSSLGTWG